MSRYLDRIDGETDIAFAVRRAEHEAPGSPVWYMVVKTEWYYGQDTHYKDNPYELRFRTMGNLVVSRHRSSHPSVASRYRDRAAAVADAESVGWVKVRSWDEAKKLAKPLLEVEEREREARWAEQDRHSAAVRGLTAVQIGEQVRYVGPNVERALLALLGDGDRDQIVRWIEATVIANDLERLRLPDDEGGSDVGPRV